MLILIRLNGTMLGLAALLILVPGLVLARLDLAPPEVPGPSFSYCIGGGCAESPDPSQAVSDEGVGPSGPDALCTGNKTSFHVDTTDCHKYFVCFNGTAYPQTCPEDMGYHPGMRLCISEYHVAACRAVNCRSNGIQEDARDCTKYYNCFYGHPYHMSCAEGTRFDPVARQCSSTIPCLTKAKYTKFWSGSKRRGLGLLFKPKEQRAGT